MEEIPLLEGHGLDDVVGVVLLVFGAEEAGEPALLAHLLVDLGGDCLLLVPLGDVGLDVGLDPLADFGAERGMGLVEVGRVLLWERESLENGSGSTCQGGGKNSRLGTKPGRRKESESQRARGPQPPPREQRQQQQWAWP